MTERVDIANLALIWVGEEPITSLEDELDRAEIMSVNYAPARDATLEAHDWSFAIERFVPPKNATAPKYGAGAAFDIPPNILRVIACDNPQVASDSAWTQPINSREQIDWVIENRQILCNEDVIYCRGIRRIEQEGLFSPNFVQAFAAKLASLTAINLTGSAEVQSNMFGLFERFIMDAKTRDGLQGRSRRLRNRTLLKVR